jgi:hypothetical protein
MLKALVLGLMLSAAIGFACSAQPRSSGSAATPPPSSSLGADASDCQQGDAIALEEQQTNTTARRFPEDQSPEGELGRALQVANIAKTTGYCENFPNQVIDFIDDSQMDTANKAAAAVVALIAQADPGATTQIPGSLKAKAQPLGGSAPPPQQQFLPMTPKTDDTPTQQTYRPGQPLQAQADEKNNVPGYVVPNTPYKLPGYVGSVGGSPNKNVSLGASASRNGAASKEKWTSGTYDGFPIWANVTTAKKGQDYKVDLPKLQSSSDSPYVSAYGKFDGTNFIVSSITNDKGVTTPIDGLKLAPAKAPK